MTGFPSMTDPCPYGGFFDWIVGVLSTFVTIDSGWRRSFPLPHSESQMFLLGLQNLLAVVILYEFLHEQWWEYVQKHSDAQVRSMDR